MYRDTSTSSSKYGVYNTTTNRFVVLSSPSHDPERTPYGYEEKGNNPPLHAMLNTIQDAVKWRGTIEQTNKESVAYWKDRRDEWGKDSVPNPAGNRCFITNKKRFFKTVGILQDAVYIIVQVEKSNSVKYTPLTG